MTIFFIFCFLWILFSSSRAINFRMDGWQQVYFGKDAITPSSSIGFVLIELKLEHFQHKKFHKFKRIWEGLKKLRKFFIFQEESFRSLGAIQDTSGGGGQGFCHNDQLINRKTVQIPWQGGWGSIFEWHVKR